MPKEHTVCTDPFDMILADATGDCAADVVLVTTAPVLDNEDIVSYHADIFTSIVSVRTDTASRVYQHSQSVHLHTGSRGSLSFLSMIDANLNANLDIMYGVLDTETGVEEIRVIHQVTETVCNDVDSGEDCRAKADMCSTNVEDVMYEEYPRVEGTSLPASITVTPFPLDPGDGRVCHLQGRERRSGVYANTPARMTYLDIQFTRQQTVMLPAVCTSGDSAPVDTLILLLALVCDQAGLESGQCSVAHNPSTQSLLKANVYLAPPSPSHPLDLGAMAGVTGAMNAAFAEVQASISSAGVGVVVNTRTEAGAGLTLLASPYGTEGFFLKGTPLNGKCIDVCASGETQPETPPYGVSYPGATLKYVTADMSNQPQVGIGNSLPASSYNALSTPYVYFGIGRVAQYIDQFYVGINYASTPTKTKSHGSQAVWHAFSGIVPNSLTVAIPYPPNNPDKWEIQ
ncbi:T-cell immunomodulatory protein, partial [Kipferlia bialata]|eukprot:g1914.t1